MTGFPRTLRYLSRRRLDALDLTTAEVAGAIERLMRARSESRAWSAPKAVIHHPDGRYMMATLAAADDPPLLAVKSLLLNPRNAERGVSTINSLITLLDSDTGVPLAVMDGNWVTAVRTAALSVVAAKRLARPDSSVSAFIGCGVQAASHLRALAATFPLKEIRAFGRGSANRNALCRMARRMGLRAVASGSAQEAVQDADLVVSSVTMSPRLVPFLDGYWLKPGAFAAVTDLAAPWRAEGMTAFERLVIDDLEQEATMAKPMVALDRVAGDLAGLVNGDIPGRRSDHERTAFVFRGIALGDLALAALAYQRASSLSSRAST
jgi:ornithine cyclodeaminase/alanine dehydrogenase